MILRYFLERLARIVRGVSLWLEGEWNGKVDLGLVGRSWMNCDFAKAGSSFYQDFESKYAFN
jgi:hypothetical protein